MLGAVFVHDKRRPNRWQTALKYNAAMSLVRDMLYATLLLLGSPIWLFRLLVTGKWRSDWAGRLGRCRIGPAPEQVRTLLIHAVSVGEVNAVRRLVAELRRRHGDRLRLVISATTNTGFARAESLYGRDHEVVRYPLDFSWAVARFLGAVRPDAVALVELELWPNFARACHANFFPIAHIPVIALQ